MRMVWIQTYCTVEWCDFSESVFTESIVASPLPSPKLFFKNPAVQSYADRVSVECTEGCSASCPPPPLCQIHGEAWGSLLCTSTSLLNFPPTLEVEFRVTGLSQGRVLTHPFKWKQWSQTCSIRKPVHLGCFVGQWRLALLTGLCRGRFHNLNELKVWKRMKCTR